ncbi:hypothetical protein C8Q79DRAFT_879040, partial [Trametes meyenii]
IYLPGRNPMFPTLFTLDRHIKAPNYGPYQGKIYFTIMNTDPQHLTKFHEFLKDAKIPNGTEEGIAQSGQCLLPMSHDNYYFSTMQLNLTPAQGPDAATAKSKFVEDLGHFGGKHTDNGDALPAFSNLVSCSDLRGNERPGIFVLLTLGLYIVLEGFVSCCFSGRHFHGGFPPHAQPGCMPDPRSYRVVIISYPSSSAFDAASKYTLANVGNNVTIELPREAIDPQADVTPTSIAADGHVLTSADALMNYLGRALAQLAHKVMGEVCSDFQVSIDTTQFLQSISYVDPAAVAALSSPGPPKRLQLKPWDLAPRSAVCSEVFGCTRQNVVRLWNDAYRRKLPFFPESSDSGLWAKYNVFSDQPLDVNENGGDGGGSVADNELDTDGSENDRDRDRDPDFYPTTASRPHLQLKKTKGPTLLSSRRLAKLLAPLDARSTCEEDGEEDMDIDGSNNSDGQEGRECTCWSATSLMLWIETDPPYQGLPGHVRLPGEPASQMRGELDSTQMIKYTGSYRAGEYRLDYRCRTDAIRPYRVLNLAHHTISPTHPHKPSTSPACVRAPHPHNLARALPPPPTRRSSPPRQRSYAMFIKKLSIFALERFRATINRSIVRLEKERPTFISTSMSASRTMYQVLHHSGKPAQFSADYGPHLATLWTAVNYQRERFMFHEVQIAMLKSEHMLAITAAWTWLDVDIPSMLYWLLQYPEKAKEQTAWLKSLLKDVQAQLLLPQERRQPLQSSKYLVLQENKEYTIKYNNHLPLQRNGSSMHDLLVKFTREALLLWLKFPSGQGQLQAGFIRTLLQHFHNPDVLLLPGMHDVFCRVRGSLLPASAVRGSRLGLNSLDDFSKYLSTQPLATPESPESAVMKNISERLEVFRTQWRQLEGGGHSASSYHRCPVLPAHVRGSDHFMEALQAAADKLTGYLQELLPLLTPPLPAQLSPLQHKVRGNPDFLLPFRQHAPEVQNAFSNKGMLHPTRVNEPGAIASLWLLRGIFYRTRFSSEHPDSLFFHNYNHWQETYKRICADPQIAAFNQDKDRYFCNARAYGQATTRSTENAEAYFEGEPAWLEMFKSKEPGWCMPYIEAYRFTQRVQRGRKILPQLGPLTGMLIAADLVYAGKVAMPSAEEMGEMVYLLDRGASACLRFFRLLDRSSDKESVISVFTSLYNKVYSSFTEAECSTMTFDPIMFEHSLCKYQR